MGHSRGIGTQKKDVREAEKEVSCECVCVCVCVYVSVERIKREM